MAKRAPAKLVQNPVLLLARLILELRALSTPTDLAELEARNIIQPAPDGWWRCPVVAALPDDAAVKITEMEQDSIGCRVRFSRPRLKGLCHKMEKLAAAWGLQVPTAPPAAQAMRRWLQGAIAGAPVPPGGSGNGKGPAAPWNTNGNGGGMAAPRVAPGTQIAVRTSGDGRHFFTVTITGFAQCRNCGGWVVWARTRNGKMIPLEPWRAGQTCTRSHFSKCHKRHTPWGWPAAN